MIIKLNSQLTCKQSSQYSTGLPFSEYFTMFQTLCWTLNLNYHLQYSGCKPEDWRMRTQIYFCLLHKSQPWLLTHFNKIGYSIKLPKKVQFLNFYQICSFIYFLLPNIAFLPSLFYFKLSFYVIITVYTCFEFLAITNKVYKYTCVLENIYSHFSWDMLRCIPVGPQSYFLSLLTIQKFFKYSEYKTLMEYLQYHITFSQPGACFSTFLMVPLNEQMSLTPVRSYYSSFLLWLALSAYCLNYLHLLPQF